MIITKDSYPLTVSQQVILIQQQFALNKSISNISIAVHFEKEIDDAVMMQAITNALYRNHSSSIQIRMNKDGSYEQYFSSKTPEPIEIIDMREANQEELEKYLREQARTEFPKDGFEVPLYRIKYILKPDGFSALYFVVCHIAFDAYSMMFLAKDAFQIYECLKEGRAFPRPLPSPVSCFEDELNYLQSPELFKDKEFWEKVMISTEPCYTNLNGKNGFGNIQGKPTGHCAFSGEESRSDTWFGRFPVELLEKVRSFAKEHNVSVQSLFILGFRNALSRVNDYVEDVSLLNALARRGTKIEKLSGGTRVSALPIRITLGNDLGFLEAVQEISKQQLAFYKHSDLPYPFIYESMMRGFNLAPTEGYASMNFTFQPYRLEGTQELPIHLQYVGNGQSSMPCYLTVMSVDNSGDLMGIYEYNLTIYPTSEKIEEFHQYLLKMLDYGVDHPDATLMELMRDI